ncbi:MAG: helix-turn-helix domain-containing protein [Aristaeellaceae bacterium]
MVAIKRIRKQQGVSQSVLAKGIGVAQSAVSQWELGTSKPSFDNLVAIARFFGCKIDDLISCEASHE